MTDPIALPRLLSALAQEAADLSVDLQDMEATLLPGLLPSLAGRADLSVALQRIDPIQQRLAALSRLAARAAEEAPPHPMPATTDCLQSVRLATFMRDLRPQQPAAPVAALIFDPLP